MVSVQILTWMNDNWAWILSHLELVDIYYMVCYKRKLKWHKAKRCNSKVSTGDKINDDLNTFIIKCWINIFVLLFALVTVSGCNYRCHRHRVVINVFAVIHSFIRVSFFIRCVLVLLQFKRHETKQNKHEFCDVKREILYFWLIVIISKKDTNITKQNKAERKQSTNGNKRHSREETAE